MQGTEIISSDISRLSSIEKSVRRMRLVIVLSVLLNAVFTVALLLFAGIHIIGHKLVARDIVLVDDQGKTFGELGVKKEWDGYTDGKSYPELRLYDEAGKPSMVTSAIGTTYAVEDKSATYNFLGVMIEGDGRRIMLNPNSFSFGNKVSVLSIDPTDTGIDLSASANGNEFGLLVSDKYASMYVSDPKAEVDISAEGGQPEINRILRNRDYVQPVH